MLTDFDSIVAMVAGLGVALLFLFVPETFWDRTPTRKPSKPPSFLRRLSSRRSVPQPHTPIPSAGDANSPRRIPVSDDATDQGDLLVVKKPHEDAQTLEVPQSTHPPLSPDRHVGFAATVHSQSHDEIGAVQMRADGQDGPSSLRSSIRPPRSTLARTPSGHYSRPTYQSDNGSAVNIEYASGGPDIEKIPGSALSGPPKVRAYTHNLRQQSAKTFTQQLRPYHGRLQNDKWVKVMFRPFILFSYPAVLWSAAVYACSVGWLMVMSEVLAMIYRDPSSYNFTSLQTGLVYISPFIGGILGTGVAGKISDIIVQAMSRRNGGLYEPEFRLVMALPIMLSTCIGLIGFGWSSEERDHFIVPTMFFGILSFGCSLGSTTSITFCVDSFRQYAGEALVTLNFAKNILHGLVFSLFVSHWLADDGPKKVFMWLGIIQLVLQLTTIPLFIFGKRARMWTVRKNFMERF